MNKLKMLMGMFFLFMLVSVFSGCSSEDENFTALNEEVEAVKSAETSKEQFVLDLKKAFAGVKKGEKPKLSSDQINLLGESAKKMLKSEGVYSSECQKLEKENKAGLILIGSLYVGMTSKAKAPNRFLKTRSSESETCYDKEKLIGCLSAAVWEYVGVSTIVKIVENVSAGSCFTAALIKKCIREVAESILKKTAAGPILAIDFMIEVSYSVWNCMRN